MSEKRSLISLLISFFILSLITFLIHLNITNTLLYSDGKFYFAYLRSIVKNHDLSLKNEFESLDIQPLLNSNQLAVSTFPIGSALLWLPLYFLVHIFTPTDSGFEIPYQISVAVSSTILVIVGLRFLYRTLCVHFDQKVSLLAITLIFLGTNVFFYVGFEPITSHAASFFVSSLFLYFFLNTLTKSTNFFNFFTLGYLSGFAGSIRPQDSLLLIIVLILILSPKQISFSSAIYKLLSTIFGFASGFLPQIFIWKLFFGFYFPPPGWGYPFHWLNPQILYVLFNKINGLVVITPTVALGFLGLISLYLHLFSNSFSPKGRTLMNPITQKGATLKEMELQNLLRQITFSGLLYFTLQLYLVSSWQDYSQGGSFGIRMMITSLPFISLGIAELLKFSIDKMGHKPTSLISSFLIFLNFILMFRYLLL